MAAALAILREEVLKKDQLILQKDEVIVRLDEQLKRQQATIERMAEQMNDLLRRLYGRRIEKLEYIPETLRVNVYKREKYGSPMGAEEGGVVAAPVPAAVVERCLADTGLQAHVAVAKFDDHLPLYRQVRMLLRQGVDISRQTMAGWLGKMGTGLAPLAGLLGKKVLENGVVGHDDTPVKMLDPGAGKTKETRLWMAASGCG